MMVKRKPPIPPSQVHSHPKKEEDRTVCRRSIREWRADLEGDGNYTPFYSDATRYRLLIEKRDLDREQQNFVSEIENNYPEWTEKIKKGEDIF